MQKIGLRERKAAKLKVGLAESLVELLEQRPLEDISIREMCETHEISEATFFNYYPKKQDVLRYFIQLWRLEMAWMAKEAAKTHGALEVIEALFMHIAEQWSQFPAFMGEMLAYQARLRDWPAEVELPRAERLQAFPEMEDIEGVEPEALDSLFSAQLGRAIDQGDLSKTCDRELLILALISLVNGVPMQLRLYEPERIAEVYQNELQLLWQAVKSG